MEFVTETQYNEVIPYLNLFRGNQHPKSETDFEYFTFLEESKNEILDFIEKYKLNAYEYSLISKYTQLVASDINRTLRKFNSKRANDELLYEYLLNLSLFKITSYGKNTVYLDFSGAKCKGIYSWFENRKMETVQFPNFLGSSKDKWLDRPLYLEIQTAENSKGKFIGSISNNPYEYEVLFMSNSKFKIIEIKRRLKTIV